MGTRTGALPCDGGSAVARIERRVQAGAALGRAASMVAIRCRL